MHLSVDNARQHVQAGRLDGSARGIGAKGADRGDMTVLHAYIGKTLAGMIDEGPALDEEIEGFGQDETFASACRLRPA